MGKSDTTASISRPYNAEAMRFGPFEFLPERSTVLKGGKRVRAEIEEHGAALNLRLCDDLTAVWADAVDLQEVIVNLVVNALQAMSDARAPSRRLTIRTERRAAGVVLAIEDEGPGIAEDHINRIFDCFFTTRPSGSGMGLSISRSIVEGWSGRILAANVAGGGARFSIELKVAE